MDIPSPPMIRVHDLSPGNERGFSRSRTSAHISLSPCPPSNPRPIARTHSTPVPPPLPPPSHIQALENGRDDAYIWGNRGMKGGLPVSTLAPIKEGSSLSGGYRNTANTKTIPVGQAGEHALPAPGRNGLIKLALLPSSRSTVPSEGLGRTQDENQKPLSPASASNQRLQGEYPLVQQSHQSSSEAYDKHVLSKIGKKSPSRRPTQSSGDNGPAGLSRGPHAKDGSILHPLAVADVSTPSFDPVSRWMSSPASAGDSPRPRVGWRASIDSRSGSMDDNSAPSSAVDQDQYPRPRDYSRSTIGGLRSGNDDTSSHPSRSNRGSFDQQAFPSDPDPDVPMEETQKLNLGDRTPPHNYYPQPFSKQHGPKRRALSRPPEDHHHHDKTSLSATNHVVDLQQRSGTGHTYSLSPAGHVPKHGSVSSTSSIGLRNGSYASSMGLSAAGSSMTSISSIDRLSPGGTSPPSDVESAAQDPAYLHQKTQTTSLKSHAAASRLPFSYKPAEKVISATRVMSGEGRAVDGPRVGGQYFICECCSKKPKKFLTEEDLRIHVREKQYKCAYCHNRFKNKNEAERHQNSLHIRHHSWSCAAIAGCYEAAFHPSTSASQTPAGASADACGYCGEEFPNLPQDWDARGEHLTNVHKFGECNQTKKFFRADHFRQHLKHSHAGTSGKWTNMLENACMKDEPTGDAAGGAAMEANESSPSPTEELAAQSLTPSGTEGPDAEETAST